MWSTDDIADAVCQGLERRARNDDAEQAVYGFDSLDELRLHPLIQQALRAAGYGVWPEQRYPSDRERNRKTEGKRCDIVLTPPTSALGSALEIAHPGMGTKVPMPVPQLSPLSSLLSNPLPLRDPETRGTLFADQPAIEPEDAYWLEIKTVAQFTTAGPFTRYSAELLAPVTADVQKLAADPLIRHAGLLLVLFTESRDIADHDLTA